MTNLWRLTGTEAQKTIAANAMAKIFFPFERLALPGVPELGWRDLNAPELKTLRLGVSHFHLPQPAGCDQSDEPHLIEGTLEGRRYTLGVFYTQSATIYLDNALVNYPAVAEATVAAEIAHAVDYFLPLTDLQRDTFIRLLNNGQPNENTWWERADYSTEYFTLAGEAFMFMFCRAYSDIPFGSVAAFEDKGENITPAQVRAVIGIERTDKTPPAPEPVLKFVRYKKSKIYHVLTHYPKRAGTIVTDVSILKLRPCKTCIRAK